MWGKFTVMEEEKDGIAIVDQDLVAPERRGKQCLVGCIIAEKQINKEAFRTTMLNVWRPTGCSI